MNIFNLLALFLGVLALSCCWFDYRKIEALEDSLSVRTLRIYGLENQVRDLQNSNNKLRADLIEHDSRIKEFEGDSYEE